MAGKKRAAATPAPPPSANCPDGAVASIPSAKRGRGRPKSTAPTAAKRGPGSAAPNSGAASELAAPKPGKIGALKKKEPQEEGSKRKKQQAAGGAEKATTPAKMMKKKGGGEAEPGSRKKKGKQESSGEAAEKPATAKKKKQASNGAEKATSPGKRKRGDAEKPKSAKKAPAAAEKPTPSKRKKKEDGEAEAKSGKKKGSPAKKAAAAAEPGSCSFPMSRVRLLMRDEDASMRATNETVFLINKASELFLEAFAKDAHQNALKERKKSIAYDNLSTSVCNQKRYKFLSDFVPLRVTAGDALKATAVDKP